MESSKKKIDALSKQLRSDLGTPFCISFVIGSNFSTDTAPPYRINTHILLARLPPTLQLIRSTQCNRLRVCNVSDVTLYHTYPLGVDHQASRTVSGDKKLGTPSAHQPTTGVQHPNHRHHKKTTTTEHKQLLDAKKLHNACCV